MLAHTVRSIYLYNMNQQIILNITSAGPHSSMPNVLRTVAQACIDLELSSTIYCYDTNSILDNYYYSVTSSINVTKLHITLYYIQIQL